MCLEMRRQNIILSSLCWFVASETGAEQWEKIAARHGHTLVALDADLPMEYCVSALFVEVSSSTHLESSFRAYFKLGLSREDISETFDFSFTIGKAGDAKDLLCVKDWETAFQVAQIYAKARIAMAASAPLWNTRIRTKRY